MSLELQVWFLLWDPFNMVIHQKISTTITSWIKIMIVLGLVYWIVLFFYMFFVNSQRLFLSYIFFRNTSTNTAKNICYVNQIDGETKWMNVPVERFRVVSKQLNCCKRKESKCKYLHHHHPIHLIAFIFVFFFFKHISCSILALCSKYFATFSKHLEYICVLLIIIIIYKHYWRAPKMLMSLKYHHHAVVKLPCNIHIS